MTYVTCPTFRYHPAVVAQKAATAAAPLRRPLHPRAGRGREPQRARRRRRLAARPTSARRCWSRRPDHPRAVRRRRLHQLPRRALRRRVGQALGPPREAGADRRRRLGQAVLRDRRRARRRDDRRRARSRSWARCSTRPAARASRGSARCRSASAPTRPRPSPGRTPLFRWFGLGWKVNAELPGPPAFDAASQFVREEDVDDAIPCGDDVDAVLEAAKEYADAGLHPPGPGADRRRPAGAVHRVERAEADAGLAGRVRGLTRTPWVRSPGRETRGGVSARNHLRP